MEILLAALAALVLGAWPVRGGLFSGEHVQLGVDAATAAAPWSEVVQERARNGVERPRNPGLFDQGHVFYPHYLWVARSWIARDPPAWNPLIYAGAPAIGNPQAGVLDPQVVPLVLAYALGGRAAFDRAFAFVAWARLAAAALGAFLLARALGLGRGPAAFAGLCFALSGYVLCWLNHSLGHVTPFLPWVLLGLEGVRGPRPWRAAAGTALALTLAILGGHPETAFYVGATAGVWALAILREDGRAGLRGLLALGVGTACAGVSLVPFVEYLERSGAKAIRDALLVPHGVDLVALGAVVAAAGLGAWFTRIQGAPGGDADERPLERGSAIAPLGLALAVGGLVLLLAGRGLAPSAALVLLPDLFGAPGDPGDYRGPASYPEVASGWVALLCLVLAFAAALAPHGPLRRRRLVTVLALVALLLTIGTPGVLDLYRHLPLVGLGATARFGAVSALMLALAGAEGLERAPRSSRFAAALVVLVLAGGALLPRPAAPLPAVLDPVDEELFGMLQVPPAELAPETLAIEGWVHPAVPVARAVLRLQKLDARGRPIPEACFSSPLDLHEDPSARARAQAPERLARAPEGATFFRPPHVSFAYFTEGDWRFAVDLFTEGSEHAAATRVVAVSRLNRPFAVRAPTLCLGALALLLVVLLPARPGRAWQAAALSVAFLQGAWFARDVNPAVPRAECFPETATEDVLAEVLGAHRYFSDPRVLPADTGMVRGLAAVDGYDGMDPASFNEYQPLCLPPGTNPLLGWNARGVVLDSPAFRLLGVGALALRTPLPRALEQGFELVAGPGTERAAETYVYRALDPLPRAFCVPRVVAPEELGELVRAGAFDPLAVACVDGPWRPAAPFTRAEISPPRWTNNTVTLAAELDGDGLLVVTDQAFPGWRARVDGEERALLTANLIFRGVPLAAGRHEVELRYEPRSLRIGLGLSAAALLAVLAFLVADVRRKRPDRGAS